MKIILYFIFLNVLLIGCLSYREGFESGTYAYLAPSSPAVLDAPTQSKFIKAYNESGGLLFNKFIITNENISGVTSDITLEEVNYYIQNNKWPYGSYIMNFLTINKDDILNKTKSKLNSMDDLQKIFPTRLVYKYLIQPTENQLSPLPLSNNIYTGKAVAPVEAPVVKEEKTSTIHPPFSSENYTKLQSICSTLR